LRSPEYCTSLQMDVPHHRTRINRVRFMLQDRFEMPNRRSSQEPFGVAVMAAFLTSWKMAIRHKFFIDHSLHLISSCYKMAMWPLMILQIFFLRATFRDTIFALPLRQSALFLSGIFAWFLPLSFFPTDLIFIFLLFRARADAFEILSHKQRMK
jgi:hypothetical protein